MTFSRLEHLLSAHRRGTILVALVTTFAGVALIIDRPKGSILEWLAIPFLVVGGGLVVWAIWPEAESSKEPSPRLAGRFLQRMTLDGRLTKLFPAVGVGIILVDFAYNVVLSPTPTLQTEDIIVLLAAAAFLAYTFVPSRFARERDFVMTFFIALNLILVVPLLLARAFYADFNRSVDVYSWVALAPESSALLSALGVANSVHAVSGATAPGLTFTPRSFSTPVTVVITTACSGIYSFGIFASAFVAFVLTEYSRLSKQVWALLGLGLLAAYVANVLRMVVIVLVGYYTDTAQTDLQNMLIAHSYLGWIIFLVWTSAFWWGLLRFLPGMNSAEGSESSIRRPAPGASCAICGRSLSPALPAVRCTCSAYLHRACLMSEGTCPTCARPAAAILVSYEGRVDTEGEDHSRLST